MVVTGEYDRLSELKAFDETKAGVKGLVDAGVMEIPRIFHHQSEDLEQNNSVFGDTEFSIPVLDVGGLFGHKDSARRKEIVERVREASEKWGFFQIVNHGIPESVLGEMKDGVRRFHEQESEAKREFYTRDLAKRVVYNSNFDLYTGRSTNWRDTFFAVLFPNPPNPEDLPSVFRDILMEYSEKVMELGILLFEVLSEALGLSSDYLKELDCTEGLQILCHYYPACPQPELTMGATRHADNDFLTILLQDHIGGLQVLHDNKWIDVPPQPGALVVNIGDLLQAMEVHEYDIERELKAFDDTKAGVKGLMDSGVTKIPRIFHHNIDDQNTTTPIPVPDETPAGVPTIDLGGVEVDPTRREEAVNEVRAASETWGFFQVVNHGVSPSVVEEMLDGVRSFFEQESDAKRGFYTRDPARPVRYNSNFDLFRVRAASWRDTLFCAMAPTPPKPEDLPVMCRDILFEYSKQVTKLGILLFELLSEALGLNQNCLRDMDCAKGHVFLFHYSPPCPEPELTLGTRKHTDGCFLTVLLQDRVGGLQIFHQNRWIDVNPISGALVVNIGDLLQESISYDH